MIGILRRNWASVFLFASVVLVFAPFMGHRVVRVAGDEKVYTQQVAEMIRDGSWFVQTLHDLPNYHKGPLHYIFLKIGYSVFGWSPWATLYMNFLFILLSSFALLWIARDVWKEDSLCEEKSLFVAGAYVFCNGVYAFQLTSQMEGALASFFVFGMYFLWKARDLRDDWKFWILAGVVGWFKSPLYSALLGASAVLYWALTAQLMVRLVSVRAWAFVFFGIGVCIVGYLPAYVMDREIFWRTYVSRENLQKGPGNWSVWWDSLWPVFSYFLIPWTFVFLVSLADGVGRLKKKTFLPFKKERFLFLLSVSLFVPSVLFFVWHKYRVNFYNVPVLGGVTTALCLLVLTSSGVVKIFYKIAFVLTGVLFFLVGVGIVFYVAHLAPLPDWFSNASFYVLVAGCFFAAAFFVSGAFSREFKKSPFIYGIVIFLFCLGPFLVVLGERELIDLRKIRQMRVEPLVYYNVQTELWSEWGLLSFMMGERVEGVHRADVLFEHFQRGDLILVPGDRYLEEFKQIVARASGGRVPAFEAWPWKRWETKGRALSGRPRWLEAWLHRDVTPLEKSYWIVKKSSSAR